MKYGGIIVFAFFSGKRGIVCLIIMAVMLPILGKNSYRNTYYIGTNSNSSISSIAVARKPKCNEYQNEPIAYQSKNGRFEAG